MESGADDGRCRAGVRATGPRQTRKLVHGLHFCDLASKRHEKELVPFAKAYSGLSNDEIATVDAFIRKNTLEKFGPMRTVKPELVFELGFEGIQRSNRHKSGVAVRFPRMLRIRTDKKIEDADSLDSILQLLEPHA